MDNLDDLFGAFDGGETANDVHEASDEPSDAAGKRKAVGEDGTAGGGATKRQAMLPTESANSGNDNDTGKSTGANPVEGASTALKEGEESSTIREDGTLVKSVRTTPQQSSSVRHPEAQVLFLDACDGLIETVVAH